MSSKAAARSKARRFLLQAMYQAELTDEDYSSVADPFIAYHNMKRADLTYFREILNGLQVKYDRLRSCIAAKLDRDFAELDPIEKSILLLGAYELIARIDIPYRVVINEGVELAKSFGATESYKLVNSVLDALSKDIRRTEQ
ncbi:MAG TPA: transcription antitermination factor NusB [Gammaproteobacteria bacterium]|nr:transcription antitermination factor NusB [Gammaproteobacteria bacterium]|tara:strand:- start:607 stop:1032 length:426 start_codon:yes stop_codon:yes gene_type:complete